MHRAPGGEREDPFVQANPELEMNTMLTALTRPRISGGVRTCTTVERITTLTMSVAPSTTIAASDSPKWRDSPNTIVATPVAPRRSAAPRRRTTD